MSVKNNTNNYGMSLIELLVALAVSSIVMVAAMTLLINGINNYRRQVVTSQIQEDADLALTHISDAVLEAEVVHVKMSDSENGSTEECYLGKGESYGYEYNKDTKVLYVVTLDSEGNKVRSVLATNVTYFKIQLLKESVEITKESEDTDKISGIKDMPQVKVSVTVEQNDIERSASRVTAVRNPIGDDGVILLGFKPENYPSVQYLIQYGFLVEE